MIFMMLQGMENEAARKRLTDFYIQYYALLKSKAIEFVALLNMPDRFHLPDDLVQDAMARMIRNSSSVMKLSEPQMVSYAVKTVKSCAHDYCRKTIAQQKAICSKEILEGADEDRIWEDRPDCFEEEDPLLRFGSILDSLPEREHDILIYKYFLGYDDLKIAELLGIKEASVRMALTRARRRVREYWEKMQIKEQAK